ncbi:MAG: HAMP domain-containing protein, partial [Candidatus Pacebacteria bacterium]|nr:HAMP domain-containing protein [Candidatus Paceibacterota bacterium]
IGHVYKGGRVHVYQPVEVKRERLGTICLVDDLSLVQESMTRNLTTMVGLAVLALLVAYLLANRLQRVVAAPILSLTETARAVAEGKDYSVRAPAYREDELGVLATAFNQMLAGIQEREHALHTANQTLEAEVDEREKAQAELKELNATLELRVLTRTRELQRSNRELEQFAYVASHDLQEPLRSIASFAELLGRRYEGKLDSDADEFIQFMVQGATRAQCLINDLLEFSRVGTHGGAFEQTDMNDVLQKVLENLRLVLNETGAEVSRSELPVVMADPAQLTQVFHNLIGNAVRFRKPDVPLRITISAEDQVEAWKFAVEDNGIGIDPKYFDRIFVIFKRLDRSTHTGTGIGLAMCKKIIERHGGDIWVESEPGKGATFLFTIPKIEHLEQQAS